MSKEDCIEVTGTVVEKFPAGQFSVQLDIDERLVLAHLAGKLRRNRIRVLAGDRVPELAGVSSPVFDAAGALAGALTLTMPKERLAPTQVPHVVRAARALTASLGGRFPPPPRA